MTKFLRTKTFLAFLVIFAIVVLSIPPFTTHLQAAPIPSTSIPVIHRIFVVDDGVRTQYDTSIRTVGEFMDDLGIEIGRLDSFLPGRSRLIENGLVIEIFRTEDGNRVTVIDDGVETMYITHVRNVETFLSEQNIRLGPLDEISVHLSRTIMDGLSFEITRSFEVNLVVDGTTERVEVAPGTTVAEVVHNLIEESDTLVVFEGNIYEGEELQRGTVVEFAALRTETEITSEPIPYTTEYVDNPTLQEGIEQIRQLGVPGERIREYAVDFIGEQEQGRELVEQTIVDPVPQIIDRGVKATVENIGTVTNLGELLGTLTDTTAPTFTYVRRIEMEASAYTADGGGRSPSHPRYGYTATGIRAEHGIVAVDPNVIPLGTRLYIEGYGFAIAADTGGAIRGNKIDLFMYSYEDAIRFGRRTVTVFVLE
ncbi:MAG: 3D domain-containing protein [Firmicutes bacterium]|nr:3D domain-containing protein [Bacillota bacterium]